MKIVTIGGGTGQFTVLSALKDLDCEICAVVSMVDSGGSTGRLRDEYGVLPPGDILKCLIALSPFREAREILQSRFHGHEKMNNHTAGNLLLVFMSQYLGGDFPAAVAALSEVLKIRGTVLPVTTDKATLVAELVDGTFIYGESEIDVAHHSRESVIKRTFLVPHSGRLEVYPPVVEAILTADFIIIGPGDLYTSLTPNFLVPGVVDAIKKTSAKLIYLSNIMTKHGETDNFTLTNFLETIERYLDREVHEVWANSAVPMENILDKYSKEHSNPVVIDEVASHNPRVILLDLLGTGELARHSIDKLSAKLREIIR